MAVVKKNFRVSRLDGELETTSRDYSMLSDEDELQRQSSASSESNEEGYDDEDEDDDDDVDSGMESDDVDLAELGAIGEELCQVGNQSFSVPIELYDLPDLSEILSVDVWNSLLTEEERFGLAEYLPDMEEGVFMRTLKELFTGGNFHFGSPVTKLFGMLKGGLCEPRVALYRQGFDFFQKRRHYHLLQKYQNYMVVNLLQISDAWANCKGYSIQEKLRVLNLMRSQKSLMYEKMEDFALESDSSGKEGLGEEFWIKRSKEAARGLKIDRHAEYKVSPTMDASSHGRAVIPESVKYGKQNPKGLLKLAAGSNKDLMGSFPCGHHGLEMKARPYTSMSSSSLQEPMSGYELGTTQRGSMAKAGILKVVKKHEFLKSKDANNYVGLPLSLNGDALHSQIKSRNVDQRAAMTGRHDRGALNYYSPDAGKKVKYPDKFQQRTVEDKMKGRGQHMLMKGNLAEDHPAKFEDWDTRGKKWKMRPEIQTGKSNVGYDAKAKNYRTFMSEASDALFPSSDRSKISQKKIKREPVQIGVDMEERRSLSQFTHSDETESDSSEQYSEEDTNSLRNKWGYSSGGLESRHYSVKSEPASKQLARRALDGTTYSSKRIANDLGGRSQMLDVEVHSLKGKQKGKMHDPHYLHNYATGFSEESDFSGLAKVNDSNRKKSHNLMKNGYVQGEHGERMHIPLSKAHPSERKQKRKVDHGYRVPHSNYLHDYVGDIDDRVRADRPGKRSQTSEAYVTDRLERPEIPLLGCSSVAKKRKKMDAYVDEPDDYDNQHYSQHLVGDSSSLKKRGKRKVDVDSGSLPTMVSSEIGLADVDPETKPEKKPFNLITPTVHTGFSFSIIHLLSAVRVAMITPLSEDVSDIGKLPQKSDAMQRPKKELENGKHESVTWEAPTHSHGNTDTSGHRKLPSLTVQEIVNRVRLNPGDPCILETQEPLQDLVRGVLKIFSSKTAPLGAKGWKALMVYEKSTKGWLWIGPVSSSESGLNSIEEETSSEAWGLPHKMLVKLVDTFANWLKNSQETLQQIGSLPPPPLSLMQPNLDEKERFRDLRAQKSLTTISPSSEEVRAYFRREEVLRYLVPDRAFSYTTADGRKSIVAPLRRCGGKPTSKARDHPILKPDRPPHVTILCLVRDAAARLPGSIGTRADVCTLIRDSQYIVEDVTDAQVNQVVSGALDRLHYERDPCVQFDGERKLWVYLHRDREEEDFEDDGTSSTKKWKRPRKDAAEQSEHGTVSVAYQGSGEQITGPSDAGYEFSADLNVEPSSTHAGERAEFVYNNLRLNGEEHTAAFVGSGRSSLHQGHPLGWDVLGLNPPQESNLLCQENATNENYDDESFNRDRPIGLISASIS